MLAATDYQATLAPAAEALALRELDRALQHYSVVEAELIGPADQPLRVPASAYRLLAQIVHELARGNVVTIVPVHEELTTQQAAELLHISRPSLIKLLERGEIPFHRVGTHRRVRVPDLVAYRERRAQAQRTGLDEMLREAQALGLYE